MKISEAIEKVKRYHRGDAVLGQPIAQETTRDKILYGDPDRELTGIVTTCYASAEVIQKAIELGANLIISHEALFWNHGDRTDWLRENKTYQAKVKLLDKGGIVVWRDHDYIHSGIPLPDGSWTDGIFYGWMKKLGWENYLTGEREMPLRFTLPETTVGELGRLLRDKLSLHGLKVIGELDSPVKNVWIPLHIMGMGDNKVITTMDEENIDTLIGLEVIDFTVAEYVRDSTQTGRPKTILAVGHFNVEEPGMEHMVEYLPAALGEQFSCTFVPSTDMYNFV